MAATLLDYPNGTYTLKALWCHNCNMPFGIEQHWYDRLVAEPGKTFYCPNGHAQHFVGKSTEDKLREQLEATQRYNANANEQIRLERAEAELQRRRAAAYKGHLTRQRRLMTNGVCPHPGCRRNFVNVRLHMRNQHPELLHELEEATK